MHRIDLPATGRTITLRHPMEAVYYIVRGAGAVLDVDAKAEQALVEGSMVHVEPDTAYRFLAGSTGMEVLGGPCPPDPALYRHLETT